MSSVTLASLGVTFPIASHQRDFSNGAAQTGRISADEFLPAYDVSDAVATVVHAGVATAWDALIEVDLIIRTRDVILGATAVSSHIRAVFLRK